MRVLKVFPVLLAIVGIGACQQAKPQAADMSWLDDLELAGAAAAAKSQLVTEISPVELGLAEERARSEATPVAAQPAAAARAPQRAAPAPRRTTTARASAPRPAPAPQREPRVVTVKNTKRDAAIGAGAGAVIGATVAGRNNRVKGAVIGAAAGGLAGAVIGSTVDVQRRVEY